MTYYMKSLCCKISTPRKTILCNQLSPIFPEPNNNRTFAMAETCKNLSGLTKESCIKKSLGFLTFFAPSNSIDGSLDLCAMRSRISSECSLDSEDSFVMFDTHCKNHEKDTDQIKDFVQLNPMLNFNSEDWSECDSSNYDSEDEVSFAVGDSLTTIHLMIAWDYAYRAARIGPWEQIARDRTRFQARISRMEDVLKPDERPVHDPTFMQGLISSTVVSGTSSVNVVKLKPSAWSKNIV
uniref:Protein phosphatase 1 regulatory subunit 15A/B C-terminal domain-containing protein n=1 Tax=Timema poppense TaxID=170557 RepID=A0A7R9H1W6_TIMPO|nr:unnamed protein product [Timema poppensis]